jgi:hypothetical protein
MPGRTRRPKVKQEDLSVVGKVAVSTHVPRWEQDLVGPALEKLLVGVAGTVTTAEVRRAHQG